VRIPSHESMKDISAYVAGEARKLGLRPDVDKEGNVLVSIGSGPSMVLNAHLDTVGVEGYPDAFSGEVKGEKLYGRGSTDCKSGVASMLELMRVLMETPPKKQVTFAFTVWEETGDRERDGAYMAVKKIRASHGIVLEDSVKEDGTMHAFIGGKGRFLYTIEVIGKATHSGLPESGVNSIYLASGLIENLRGLRTSSMEIPGVGKAESVFSITQIEAKEGSNVIPGRCFLTADYRALPGESEPDVRKRVEQECRKALGKSFRLSLAREAKRGFMETDQAFTRLCLDSMRKAGMKPLPGFTYGWDDAAVFQEAGIKTMTMGPGTIGQDHRSPEYCWVPGLVKGTRAVLNVIRGWDES